uniref:Phage protein n=1 Tax=Meloidogyne javanica TaxID=6303 RepID=A0A915M499_MELJA
MVNAYKIDFDNSSTGHKCQFIPDEQTVVGNYLYVLDDYKAYVDQRMEEIFDEEYAQTILEG